MADAVNSDNAELRPYRILKEYLNGVMDTKGRFYPYRVASGTTDIAGKNNVQYFIRRAQITYKNEGVVAAGALIASIAVQGVSTRIFTLQTASQTQATDFASDTVVIDVCLLGDANSKVDFTATTIAPQVVLTYAEVDYDPEYAS